MDTTKDDILFTKVEAYLSDEQLLQAARLLSKTTNLTARHKQILRKAQLVETAVQDLLASVSVTNNNEVTSNEEDGQWKKQGESHGKYATTIYYKMESGARLTCRMESPIPSNLLVPLLSVLNESSLYQTWIPSWNRPIRVGVRKSEQLLNDTRGHQVLHVQCDVPWPMYPREVIIDVTAVDDIDARGFIIVKMKSARDGDGDSSGFALPRATSNMERVDFDGAMLFRKCPTDHPNYANSKKKFPSEQLLLVQLTVYFDANMPMVPQSVVNFVTRTVIGHVWSMLLTVAEEVRDGSRAEHKLLISHKPEFYKWVEERCQRMQYSTVHKNSATTQHPHHHSLTPMSARKSRQYRQTKESPSSRKDAIETMEWTLDEVLQMSI